MKLNDVILEAASPAQQAAIAIAKKKKAGVVKEQQLNEFAPLLALGARLFMAAAPKIAQVAGRAGQAGARGASQAAKAGTEIAAKNAGQIGMGVGAYEIGSSVADIAKDIAAKVGTAIDEKTVLDLAALAFKYAIPAGIVLAVLYGGKKAIDSLFDDPKAQPGVAEGKADYNFDIEDLKRLEQIRDLATLKAQALTLISKPSAKPMKPEKVEWFKNALERMNSPLKVIKLMYDLLLSGEGKAVVGSRSSMNPNSYRQRFSEQGMAEDFNGEYDDEAGMAETNLITIARAAQGLLDTIDNQENLPEWVQEKIAKVEGMMVVAWDYLKSQEVQGIDPRITESICTEQEAHEIFDDFERVVAARGLNEDIYDRVTDEDIIRETAAWRRKEGKSKKGGLNAKGVASYRRENPGSKLQMAVTTKPSKLKKGSKASKRRKSFCARMSGVKGPMKKPNGKPTRKALALRKWNC